MRYALKSSALAVIAALLLSGCGSRESQVERAVERELPRIVGPAESYDVDVQGIRGATGADRVTVRGRRVQPAGSPVLDQADIILIGVFYNPACAGLERIAGVSGTVRVLGNDIASFLENNRNLQDVEVQLQSPNQVIVRARPEIEQLMDVEVETTGALVSEGPRINYQLTQVRAGGVSLPDPAPRLLSQELNPVVDLAGIPIILQVPEVRVEGNAVIAGITGRYPP